MQTAPAPGPAAMEMNDSSEVAGSKTDSTVLQQPRRPPEEEPTDYWSYDLFGCLSDWRLCCATFLCPCYTLGRNAAYFGDDGALSCVLCFIGFYSVSGLTHTAFFYCFSAKSKACNINITSVLVALKRQESVANAKVSTRQQCLYDVP